MNDQSLYLYLNREGKWLDFHWEGLELQPHGSLRLATVPLFTGEPSQYSRLQRPDGPAGLAQSPNGILYISVPTEHRLFVSSKCEPALSNVRCISQHTDLELTSPRGLLFHRIRQVLIVADTDNHRLQIFSPDTFQLLDVWGNPGTAPGSFNKPVAVTDDKEGNVYVVDSGNKRIQKFTMGGEVVPTFWDRMSSNIQLYQPIAIQTVAQQSETEIYVLDAGCVYVVDLSGKMIRSFELREKNRVLSNAMGLAVDANSLYVGDNDAKKIFKFTTTGTYIGEAVHYEGPVAALSIGPDNTLLVNTGSEIAPPVLVSDGAYVHYGWLWGGPFQNPNEAREQWHRIKSRVRLPESGAHVQLYYTSDPNPSAPVDIQNPFRGASWISVPLDAAETLFQATVKEPVSVAMVFFSEGNASAELTNIRIDFNHETYLQYLPALYQEDDRSNEFLMRFLSIFQSVFEEQEENINDLPALFDPFAIPVDFLGWLAAWLGLELNEEWHAGRKRELIASAFARYAWRGTSEGLRNTLRSFAGIEARIDEPILESALWILPKNEIEGDDFPETSVLGFNTMLAGAEPYGAYLGSSTILDHSYLISSDQSGEPLFKDVAYRFNVRVYRGSQFSDQWIQAARDVIDREKPVHTSYHLCVTEPQMRLGFQSQIGIDTIVGQSPLQGTSERETSISGSLVLGGNPPGRIGVENTLGQTTRLGQGSVNESRKEFLNKSGRTNARNSHRN